MAEKKTKYKTAPLKCWNKAKELRLKYYQDYATAHERGGIRWAGGAWSFQPIMAGLGDDVYGITGEPYGASIGTNPAFATQCQEACEAKGFARDLCSYMRSYWGSVILNKYFFGGEFPKPDILWQDHICCQHAKWYQVASELEGGIPYFATDVSVGPYSELDENKLNYVAGQLLDGIEWLEKVTGRKYDDERLIQAVYNECRITSLWAEISALNKAIPAPLDEKTMFSLYVLSTLDRNSKEFADFHEEIRDEIKDRVDNQIAAVGNERFRIMTDSQPPWAALRLFRFLEKYGVVSIGAFYTMSLMGIWEDKPDGSWGPATTPQDKGIVIKDREQAVRVLVDWNLKRTLWEPFYDAELGAKRDLRIAKEWHVDACLMHLNLGCEGTTVGNMERRLALINAGIPVLTYEGNMADDRQYDEVGTMKRVEIWMNSLGLKKLED